MKVKHAKCLVSTLLVLLQGCGAGGQSPLALGPDADKVRLVMYYSDGDNDWKTVGETMLIHTGETIKVKRNAIRPDPSLITNDWNNKFLPLMDSLPQSGGVELRLDRSKGVACLALRCATVYDICPRLNELKQGKRCQSFATK